MTRLVCITNDRVPGIRPCTHRSAHLESCDGWQYRWNFDTERDEATGKECTGCAPREARVGMLCWACWETVSNAFARWDQWLATVDGVDRLVRRDNAGVRSSDEGHVNLAGTYLAIDECWRHLQSREGRPLEAWVSNADGARDAVQFAGAAESAYRTHEIEERPHKVRRVRCQRCSQVSLIWNPTPVFGGHVTVTCQTEGCGAELDQTSFEKVAEIVERAQKGRAVA